jgi:hypothetical protein
VERDLDILLKLTDPGSPCEPVDEPGAGAGIARRRERATPSYGWPGGDADRAGLARGLLDCMLRQVTIAATPGGIQDSA